MPAFAFVVAILLSVASAAAQTAQGTRVWIGFGSTPQWSVGTADPGRATLYIGGRRVHVDVELWRTFQPPSPGGPLMASIRLSEGNGRALPPGLQVVGLKVTRGFFSWLAAPKRLGGTDPNRMEYSADCGPRWPTGDRVRVFVTLRYAGRLYEARISHVKIQAVH